jgi:hypothetical protein
MTPELTPAVLAAGFQSMLVITGQADFFAAFCGYFNISRQRQQHVFSFTQPRLSAFIFFIIAFGQTA